MAENRPTKHNLKRTRNAALRAEALFRRSEVLRSERVVSDLRVWRGVVDVSGKRTKGCVCQVHVVYFQKTKGLNSPAEERRTDSREGGCVCVAEANTKPSRCFLFLRPSSRRHLSARASGLRSGQTRVCNSFHRPLQALTQGVEKRPVSKFESCKGFA